MSDDLFTQQEMAEKRKCSEKTLERERISGKGCPFVRLGARIYYRRLDWEEFLLSQRRTSTSDIGEAA